MGDGGKGAEEVERGRGFSSVINTDSFLPTAILNHTKKSRRRDGGFIVGYEKVACPSANKQSEGRTDEVEREVSLSLTN